MNKKNNLKVLILSCLCTFIFYGNNQAFADGINYPPTSLEAQVRAEVEKDLSMPYAVNENLLKRKGIDGREISNFDGNIVEYWINLECSYCDIHEALKAQQENENIRIVIRHLPSDSYGESLKKSLSYEALKTFSANAANMFWDKIIPNNSRTIPVPYEASLMLAFQEAAISPEEFGNALEHKASEIVNEDILAGYGKITSTPTYVLEGIRFPACNFTAEQLPRALDLAIKARNGDEEAIEKIINIIVQGLVGEIKF